MNIEPDQASGFFVPYIHRARPVRALLFLEVDLAPTTHDVAMEVSKAAPVLTMAGATFMGISLDLWIQLLTLAYLIFLLVEKSPVVFSKFVVLGQRIATWWAAR